MESPVHIEYKNQPGNRYGTVTLERFKIVATNALMEHEDLQDQYGLQEVEIQELQAKLRETEESLFKLTNVTEKACLEMVNLHEDLECKIDVEQRCREEAENYASKMVKQNKKIIRENKEIKRKSMAMLGRAGVDHLQVFEISLDDIADEPEEASPDEPTVNSEQSMLIDELQYTVTDLNYKLEEAKSTIERLEQEKAAALEKARYHKEESSSIIQQLALESTSHEVTKAALKERDKTLMKLNRVSTLVIQEYEDVSSKYEEATVLREEAEKLAIQMISEKKAADAAQRRSLMLLDVNLEESERIAGLLEEVKQLTKTLEEERLNHKKEMEESQERLTSSEDVTEHESLREKLRLAEEEMTSADKKLEELEHRNSRLVKEVEDMREAARPPAPPPPPPPPPPPIARNPLKILKAIIHRSNTTGGDKAKPDPQQDKYNATIEEMMKRIKKGQVKLRSVNENPSQRREDSTKGPDAVLELSSMLKSIKKNHGNKFTAIPPGQQQAGERELSEFERKMQERRAKTSLKIKESSEVITKQTDSGLQNSKADDETMEEPKSTTSNGEVKKAPVPAPRINTSPKESMAPYQDVIPAPIQEDDNEIEVEVNPVYDSVGEDEQFTVDPLGPKENPKLEPDDQHSMYSLVNN